MTTTEDGRLTEYGYDESEYEYGYDEYQYFFAEYGYEDEYFFAEDEFEYLNASWTLSRVQCRQGTRRNRASHP